MQTGRSQVGYPVEEGNSEVTTYWLPCYDG